MFSPIAPTPKKMLSAIHNLPRKMRNVHPGDRPRARGKENIPPGHKVDHSQCNSYSPTILVTSKSSQVVDRHKWLPKDGMIIIKVAVPCTNDLWKFKVPEYVTLEEFLVRVETKVGFPVVLFAQNGHLREWPVATERGFTSWVAGRICPEDGRNTPLIAHVRI